MWGSLGGHLDPSGVIWAILEVIWGTSGVTRWSMEGHEERHVLLSRRFKLFLRPPKKPQDEATDLEDGAGTAQGGRWEGHVLK